MPDQCSERPTYSSRKLLVLAVALLFVTSVVPAIAAEATATPADDGKSWLAFFGRLHVVVLHLPIGLLIGAFAIEFFGLYRRSRGYDISAAWLFVLGAIASVPAVVSGLLLGVEKASESSTAAPSSAWQMLWADSLEQGVSETLGWHMWLGVTLMIVAFIAAGLKIAAVRRQWPDESRTPRKGGWPLMTARAALIGTMLLLPFAGHLGGNLVHGEQYLFERSPVNVPKAIVYWPEEVPKDKVDDGSDPETPGTLAFWNAKIQPAMNKHCTACHDASKQNGELRLDSLEWALEGGSITPTDPESSEIYRRVILPPTHDEFMPTNTKKFGIMSQQDTHALGEWIMAFDGMLKSSDKPTVTAKQPTKDSEPVLLKPLIDPIVIEAIEKAGGSAQSLSLTQQEMSVKFAYLKQLDADTVAELGKSADMIAWLTFEGSALDDKAIEALPTLPKLTRLNLKDTNVTDAGLKALPELPNLEWLNLFGTEITDEGLNTIVKLKSLKKVYVTGTSVTAEGVARLREALPDTEIISDHNVQFQVATPEDQTTVAKSVNVPCPVNSQPIKYGQLVGRTVSSLT